MDCLVKDLEAYLHQWVHDGVYVTSGFHNMDVLSISRRYENVTGEEKHWTLNIQTQLDLKEQMESFLSS